MFLSDIDSRVEALCQSIWAQWLTYLEPSHVYIYKEGVSSMNLESYEDLLIVCYYFCLTGGSLMVLACFKMVLSMSDIRLCQRKEYQLIILFRV